jgi:hypothetical protein
MANKKQQLEVPSIPSLGFAPEGYQRSYFGEINGSLNGYFRSLISTLGALFGVRGGKFLNTPHGSFHDSTDQVAASTTVATAVIFGTTDISNGVTLSNSSRLNVADSGVFNIQFSIQLKNTTNDSHDVDIWFRKNGTNIDNSNSRFHLPARKSTGDPSHLIAALNFFVELSANDYVEIMYKVDNVNVTIEHFAASSTPTRPAVPSVIATVSFVSNLPTI